MRILAVIPARYAATRFPGKPLAELGGRPVIQWVYEAAVRCPAFDEVVVATDDPRILETVRGFDGLAELTRADHRSGTDRVAELAGRRPDAEVIVNVQGDQPFASAESLAALVEPYVRGGAPPMTTLACPLTEPAARSDPNTVKVVCDVLGNALYFSRACIPHSEVGSGAVLHHLGLYAFTRDALLRFAALDPTPLAVQEDLEQLRALEHGMRIRVCQTGQPALEINTPEDLDAARRLLAAG